MTNAPDDAHEPPPPAPPPAGAARRRYRIALAAGFAALLLLAFGLWLRASRGASEAESQASSQNATAPAPVSISVVVRSATRELLSGAHVSVTGVDDAHTSNVTDRSGTARLTVPAGPLAIEVTRQGFGKAFARAEAGDKPLRVEFELEPERVLEGSVIDDRGEPLADARVHVFSLDAPDMSGWDTTSDEAGHFRVEGLPRHELSIEVVHEGHEGHERALGESYDESLSIVLPRQGELLVSVRDQAGKPVTGAELLVTGTGLWPAAAARSDERGEHLFTALASGQYRARAHHAQLAALPSEAIEVVPGARARVELVLSQGARACGRVLDGRDRKPVVGAHVAVHELTPGMPPRTTVSDQDGNFELVGLWPGTVRLEVQHDGYAPLGVDTRLPMNECARLQLSGAANIEGVVLDERGRPVEGALVSVSTREGLPVALRGDANAAGLALVGELGVTSGPVPRIPLNAPSAFSLGSLAARSDERGAFRISGLAPTPIALHVARSGFAPTTLPLDDLTAHETRRDVLVTMRQAGRIEGRVRDARGRGVAGVYLSAHGAGGLEQSALSDSDGNFVVPDVLGEVTVEATASGYAPVSCNVTVRAASTARCPLALDSALHELAVRVEDERGQPLEGALVAVRAASATRRSSQTTRADGSAVVRELPEPPYLVDVLREGYLAVRDERVERAGRELRIAMSRASSVSGIVTDALGRPVRGAYVSTDEGDATADSDAEGAFVLEGVAPGVLVVWAKHKRAGEGESAELRARPGELTSDVRIVLDGHYVPSSDDARPHEKPAEDALTSTAAPAPASPQAPPKPQALTLDQRGPRVLVSAVASGSPGDKAGMRPGDVLLSVDGETVFSAAQGRGMLRDPPNTTAAVRVSRDGRVLSLRFRRAAL